jgi:hypothetical protein
VVPPSPFVAEILLTSRDQSMIQQIRNALQKENKGKKRQNTGNF